MPSLVPALIASPDPYKPFLPLLQHSSSAEDPIPLLTSDLLISLVPTSLKTSSKCPPRDEAALPKLYTYLSTLTRNQDSGLQDIGVQGFSGLLRTQRSRELFWNLRTETVEPLMDILWAASGGKDNESTTMGATGSIRTAEIGLAGGVGLQLLYNVLVVIWQLSFEAALVGSELQAYGTRFPPHFSRCGEFHRFTLKFLLTYSCLPATITLYGFIHVSSGPQPRRRPTVYCSLRSTISSQKSELHSYQSP